MTTLKRNISHSQISVLIIYVYRIIIWVLNVSMNKFMTDTQMATVLTYLCTLCFPFRASDGSSNVQRRKCRYFAVHSQLSGHFRSLEMGTFSCLTGLHCDLSLSMAVYPLLLSLNKTLYCLLLSCTLSSDFFLEQDTFKYPLQSTGSTQKAT